MSKLHIIIIGIFVTALGKYFGDYLTDIRQKKEEKKDKIETVQEEKKENKKVIKERFKKCQKEMIEFFQNLKQDLLDYPLVTEFVVIHKGIPGFTPDNCFIYVSKKFRDYKIHENLLLKVRMLEDNNFVIDISTGDIPHFKMTPEFKDLVITEDT